MTMKRFIGLSLGIIIGGSVIGWLFYRYEPWVEKQAIEFVPFIQKLKAQTTGSSSGCSSCTVVITSNQTNLTVNSGQTVCIAPGVLITGNITVRGTLCNQGTIDASSFDMGGNAKVFNHGQIIVSGNLVLNQNSEFYNYGSLQVSGNVNLNNNSKLVNTNVLAIENSLIINNNASFENQGTVDVGNDMHVNGNGNVTNTGEIDVNGNLHVNGSFVNNGTVAVENNFIINNGGSFNSTGGIVGCVIISGTSTVNGCLGCNDNPLNFCDLTSSNGGAPDIQNNADIGSNVMYCNNSVSCGSILQTSLQLIAQNKTPQTVLLTWNPISNAQLYKVEYGLKPNFENATLLTTLTGTNYEVNLTGLPSSPLFFRVTAQLENGSILTSNVVEITPSTLKKVTFQYVRGNLRFSDCLKELHILDLTGREIVNESNVCSQIPVTLTPNQVYIITYVDEQGNPGNLKLQVLPG